MKKTLVMLALSTVGFAPVFGATPATTPQTQPQQPATTQPTPAKPVEIKKVAGATDDQKTPTTPTTPTTKPKLVLIADEKPGCCPCPTDKKDPSVEKKDGQKTPAQPAKATPPKVALA